MFLRRFAALIVAAAAAGGFVTGPAQATQDGVSPMVVGGTRAPAGAYPWMVRLSMGCGAALVGARVVLTAAHCVSSTGANTSLTATIGKVDLQASGGQVIRSTYVYRAPEYGSTGTQDWALVELASAPTAPVLKFAGTGDTSLHTGDFTIMGWGKTTESGIDTCQNDSGGPMVKRNAAGEWVEIGIVSYGRGCARPGVPGVYAEVQALSTKVRARISPNGTIVR